jgi:hypothetical protein
LDEVVGAHRSTLSLRAIALVAFDLELANRKDRAVAVSLHDVMPLISENSYTTFVDATKLVHHVGGRNP